MNQHSCSQGRKKATASSRFTEPSVRHWSYPTEGPATYRQTEPMLHYLCCTLSYQNQLLSEIKSALEQLSMEQDGQQKSN